MLRAKYLARRQTLPWKTTHRRYFTGPVHGSYDGKKTICGKIITIGPRWSLCERASGADSWGVYQECNECVLKGG